MSLDTDARQTTINYEGGSLTMTLGNFKSLFGEDNPLILNPGLPVTRTVKGHSRTPVIGGVSKTIGSFSYSMTQWPTNNRSNAAGGEPVVMNWTGSQGEWQGRVSGPLWKLGEFLSKNSSKSVWFHVKGGKGYGPFSTLS